VTAGLNELWGGILDSLLLDIAHQTATLVVRVPIGEHETSHRLEVRGIHDFRFANAIPGPWSYAELTEIRMDTLPTDRMRLAVMLWSEQASLIMEADAAMLDGVELMVRNDGC